MITMLVRNAANKEMNGWDLLAFVIETLIFGGLGVLLTFWIFALYFVLVAAVAIGCAVYFKRKL